MERKTKASTKQTKISNSQFLEMAKRKSGVIDARIISPSQVETAGWVRLKCQFGCDGFGQCLVCPPFTPTPQQMREVLDSYHRAVLIHCEPDADVKAIAAELERDIFLLGCWKAFGPNSISLKYDPMGNRVWRQSTVSGQTTTRKYIIDISGDLPTILMEINTANGALMKTYIYANSQILAQHNGDHTANRYFYLHDRLGSVRLVVDDAGDVNNTYTYNPFGEMFPTECTENVSNPFKFTGQFYDSEIGQCYLRARMYDPQLMRFTARDPVNGRFKEPLTLHKYLYCLNDPINYTDPTGKDTVAETLVANSILGSLRSLDSKFSSQLFGESVKAKDIFNVIGMEQAIRAELLIAQFEGGLTRSSINGIVSTLNMVASNLTDTVLANKLWNFGNYLAGDYVSGRLDWLSEDPSIENFLQYLNVWGSNARRLDD